MDKPCVGSGYCCSKAPCPVGVMLHGQVAPCPSLVHRDGRFWCGEILDAEGEDEGWLRKELAIGAGCCSPLNSARPDSPFHEEGAAERIRLSVLTSSSSSRGR